MTTWLISSNDAYFKLNELFKERPTIDWKQDNHKYAVGDIILFYSAKPDGRIMYEGEVIKTNLVESETDDDSEFIIDRAKYIKNNKYWMRIRFTAFSKEGSLTLEDLKNNGFKGIPRGVRKTLPKCLLQHIDQFMQPLDCIYPDSEGLEEITVEGAKKTITVNVYERNPTARATCIAKYGCKCYVCDLDFGTYYGEFASGFIHVHHIVPISQIGEEYEVNPETDLIPLCPNCHAVIHMKLKLDPTYTIEDLKKEFKARHT